MALVRWTPMRSFASFQDEMNRMFDEFFRGGNGEEAGWGLRTWTPPVDIYETNEALILKAELPGVSKDDVSIEVHNNILILKGQRKHEAEVKDEHYYRAERAYGTFQRSFVLPTMVDQEKVQATYKDGVLELRLPKVEAAKPKRIAIASQASPPPSPLGSLAKGEAPRMNHLGPALAGEPRRVGEEPEATSDHWWERIDYNSLVMAGTPLIKGVPVWQVMKQLAHTLSVEEVLRAYPHLTTDDLQAALAYAAASAQSTPH